MQDEKWSSFVDQHGGAAGALRAAVHISPEERRLRYIILILERHAGELEAIGLGVIDALWHADTLCGELIDRVGIPMENAKLPWPWERRRAIRQRLFPGRPYLDHCWGNGCHRGITSLLCQYCEGCRRFTCLYCGFCFCGAPNFWISDYSSGVSRFDWKAHEKILSSRPKSASNPRSSLRSLAEATQRVR